jgi:hypothetical protein
MERPNKKTIEVMAVIIAVIIFIIALVLLFLRPATVILKYGTPAEHGSSYK